ncbi:MAG TPA: phosphate regulon sensor histidine kinase PhoR [Rhodocyclaceae bacterium]|nr:phosphate regulon sensor histidine kinase PhoR [Rhodocyclaceae bacterium]
MHRRNLWANTALILGFSAAGGVAIGLAFGRFVGALAFCAALLALLAFHLYELHRLSGWACQRDDALVPPGHGPWVPLTEALERRQRAMRDEQQRLAVALGRFRAASQAMPDGVIYLSGRDAIEWLNRRAEQHFGLSHIHDLGVPITGLVRDDAFVHYLEARAHDEPLLMAAPRRPQMRLLVQVVPFGDGQKILVSRDITQLEKLETMRRDFIANVSHELRTPLTVVGGFVETVLDGLDELARADIERYLNLALEQSTRMQRLIEDLLALSALETGAPAPTEEPVDALELVRKVHQEAELLSNGRHRIELDVDARDDGDILLGSQRELHSAFANLASNAVRYTPAGGTIRLVWRRTPAGGEFAVEDNGIGIDAQHIARLTERFFRVDRGRSRETGGTGLGLAIVKHIVSRHQAELRIDSAPGAGSRFSVAFPASRLKRSRLPLHS